MWVEGRLIPGAFECIRWLQANGYPVVYLTNNPVRPMAYAVRLTAHGLPTSSGDVISASGILKEYLVRRRRAPTCMCRQISTCAPSSSRTSA